MGARSWQGAVASSAKNAGVGAVYTQTNDPAGNSVVVFDRYANGTLQKREAVSTGGNGSAQSVGCGPGLPDPGLPERGRRVENGKLVFAVNAGSDTVTSFRETTAGLKRVNQVSSGGDMPESLALNGDLLYVLNVATANSNGTTGNIYGLRVHRERPPDALVGSSQPLANAAPPDALVRHARAIEFKPNGKVIVVTELAGGLRTGRPPGSDRHVRGRLERQGGPGGLASVGDGFPFGFAFDNNGHADRVEHQEPGRDRRSARCPPTRVSNSGDVTPIDTEVLAAASLPCWVVVTSDGQLHVRGQHRRRAPGRTVR